jgi:hypothetical protein
MLIAMPKIVFKMVALVFERVEHLIFGYPRNADTRLEDSTLCRKIPCVHLVPLNVG